MPVNKDFYTLAGSSGQSTGYEISKSLRFNDGDSAFLLDAGTDAGDTRKKNTWSVWVKRGALSSAQYIAAYRYDATNYQYLLFKADNKFEFTDVTGGSVQMKVVTNREFRDPSAWYHIVCVWDTADGAAGNRARIYVNGVRETSLNTTTYPSQNADSGGAGRADARLRFGTYDATGNYFDGYLAEVHYTDNYAYDPSNFGEFKEDTDIWIPKEADVSYGSAGAYLDFKTSGTLGANTKGKGNFSTSGIVVTDQMIDTPTNNFCVMSSAAKHSDSGFTIGNGNLELTRTAGNNKGVYATVGLTFGKWYWEVRTIHGTSYNIEHGVIGSDAGAIIVGTDVNTGSKASGYSLQFNTGDYYKYHGGSNSDTGVNATSPSFQAFALDMDNKKIWFGYAADGDSSITWFESGDPAGGSNHIYALDDGSDTYYPCHNSSRGNGTQQARFNFGQDGTFAGEETATQTDSNGEGNFFFAPPSGFLAICTKNLSA